MRRWESDTSDKQKKEETNPYESISSLLCETGFSRFF